MQIFAIGILLLDGHVIILDDYQLGKVVPFGHHALCHACGIVAEVFCSFDVSPTLCYFFYLGLHRVVVRFKSVTYAFELWEEEIVAEVDHVADPVAYPEGVFEREGEGVCALVAVAVGDALHRAWIYGGEGYHVGFVIAVPQA